MNLNSSAVKLTTYRSMCLANEGGTALLGYTKCGPEVHWLTDCEGEPGGSLCCASHRMGNVTDRETWSQCGVTVPSVADGSELVLYARSCTTASYRKQNKNCDIFINSFSQTIWSSLKMTYKIQHIFVSSTNIF